MSMHLAPGTLDGDEPIFVSALAKIRDAAKAHGLPVMGFGISPGIMRGRMEMGWNAFIIHGDVDAICTSAGQALRTYGEASAAKL